MSTSRHCQRGDPHFCAVGRCAALHSAGIVSHSVTVWVLKSGIADGRPRHSWACDTCHGGSAHGTYTDRLGHAS